MIPRQLEKKIKEYARYFPVLFLTGPRQSGKTTLVRHIFNTIPYYSMENPDTRQLALSDPRGFLGNLLKGAVIDEAQRVPHLFNYIQEIVDNDPNKRFILSGSQNFLMHEKITQSLAGRTGVLSLLPFCYSEFNNLIDPGNNWEEVAFRGFYPRLLTESIPPDIFYSSYTNTYVERDVRLLKNVGDLAQFTAFLKLCAGRVGQLVNYTSLSNDIGVSSNTVKEWLSILEQSFILFKILPYHKNFNKRLTKMPKIYFYDTGLLCYLLGITKVDQIQQHFALGGIFENLVILESLKSFKNVGANPPIYFWRDNKGKEIDMIIEHGNSEIAVEIKAGRTMNTSYFDNLKYWLKMSGNPISNNWVITGNSENTMSTSYGEYTSWKKIGERLTTIQND